MYLSFRLAIREALLNALIHRRYSAVGPVKIALFDDRLEIFSPGNFPGPFNLNELGSGVSYHRNPTIASLTRRLGLVERRGLGFLHMLQSCRENNNPPPEIIEGSDFIKVILYKKALNVSAGTARDRIRQLLAMGIVVEEGKGRATRYRWR